MKYLLRCIVVLAGAHLAVVPSEAKSAAASPLVSELVDALAGEFDSRRQMQEDKDNAIAKEKSHAWINRGFVKVATSGSLGPALVGSTYYASQPWIFDTNEFLVWTFAVIENGETVLAVPRRFKNQTNRLAFARDPLRLSGFSADDLEPARSGASCPIYWKKTEQGFEGKTRNCRAMSTVHNKMMHWEWAYMLRDEALFIEFFGKDDSGKVLDGTPKGNPYRLDRAGFSEKTVSQRR